MIENKNIQNRKRRLCSNNRIELSLTPREVLYTLRKDDLIKIIFNHRMSISLLENSIRELIVQNNYLERKLSNISKNVKNKKVIKNER